MSCSTTSRSAHEKVLPPLPFGGLQLDFSGDDRAQGRRQEGDSPIRSHIIPPRHTSLPRPSATRHITSPSLQSPSTPTKTNSAHASPYGSPNRSNSTITKLGTASTTSTTSTTSTPTKSTGRVVFDTIAPGSVALQSPVSLSKKRSSGQLLFGFGKGFHRVGSVMRRNGTEEPSVLSSSTSSPSSAALLDGDGSGTRGLRDTSRQRTWRKGSKWNKRSLIGDDDPCEHGQSSETNEGDAGVGRPYNVTHDLHVSPDFEGLPDAWLDSLKAQGLTETDLLMISAARKRQHDTQLIPLRQGLQTSSRAPLSAPPGNALSASHSSSSTDTRPSAKMLRKFSFEPDSPTTPTRPSSSRSQVVTEQSLSTTDIAHLPNEQRGAKGSKRFSDQLRVFKEHKLSFEEEWDRDWGSDILGVAWSHRASSRPNVAADNHVPRSPPPPARHRARHPPSLTPIAPNMPSLSTSPIQEYPRKSSDSFGVHYACSGSKSSVESTLITPSTSALDAKCLSAPQMDQGYIPYLVDSFEPSKADDRRGRDVAGESRVEHGPVERFQSTDSDAQVGLSVDIPLGRLNQPYSDLTRPPLSSHFSLPASVAATDSVAPSRASTPTSEVERAGSSSSRIVAAGDIRFTPYTPYKDQQKDTLSGLLNSLAVNRSRHDVRTPLSPTACASFLSLAEHAETRGQAEGEGEVDPLARLDQASKDERTILSSRTSSDLHDIHDLREATVRIAYKGRPERISELDNGARDALVALGEAARAVFARGDGGGGNGTALAQTSGSQT